MPMEQNHVPQGMFEKQNKVAQGQSGPQSKESKGTTGLVSIVVPCCGQLEYTRLCVPRLLQYSRPLFELIFIDVCSLDGTADFLAGVATAATVRVQVIHGRSESAFEQACKEGLLEARGEFVVWLNNDTLVTSGWLQKLIALASSQSGIGMVGPMSNCSPGLQRVESIPYRIGSKSALNAALDREDDGEMLGTVALDRFAQEWRELYKGKWFETDRIGGFCFLLKRAVLQALDYDFFDEKSQLGVFDMDKLCLRIRQAGYRLAVCQDLFIHHFGSRLVSDTRDSGRRGQ